MAGGLSRIASHILNVFLVTGLRNMLRVHEKFIRAGCPSMDPLKSAKTLPLLRWLYGFRNVPDMDVSGSSFPCWPFFITETEMLAFRCFGDGLDLLKIPMVGQFEKRSHYQHQRLGIRWRIVGL